MKIVNLDWLELYLHEGEDFFPLDANYFVRQGYKVEKRQYGTPQYSQMFTIYDRSGKFPLYEIRRAPYSLKRFGGIFDENSCHLRLSNRQCYSPTAIEDLRKFLVMHQYTYDHISRVDICADFNHFDNGDDPSTFIRRYMANQYHKIGLSRVHVYGQDYSNELVVLDTNKGRIVRRPKILHRGQEIAAHGEDTTYTKQFHSLKWGSPSSRISTKLYNKSKELNEVAMKFHILDNWTAAQLNTKNVWRLEYSINSDAKNWVNDDTGEVFKLGLSELDSPDKLNFLWNILTQKYFLFTCAELTRNGTPRRKNRCPHYLPFNTNKIETYRPIRLTQNLEPTRTDKLLIKKLNQIVKNISNPTDVRESARNLIGFMAMRHRTDATYSDRIFHDLASAVQ